MSKGWSFGFYSDFRTAEKRICELSGWPSVRNRRQRIDKNSSVYRFPEVAQEFLITERNEIVMFQSGTIKTETGTDSGDSDKLAA